MMIRRIRTCLQCCAIMLLALIGERIALGMTWTFYLVGHLTELTCATTAILLHRQNQPTRTCHQ